MPSASVVLWKDGRYENQQLAVKAEIGPYSIRQQQRGKLNQDMAVFTATNGKSRDMQQRGGKLIGSGS